MRRGSFRDEGANLQVNMARTAAVGLLNFSHIRSLFHLVIVYTFFISLSGLVLIESEERQDINFV